MMGTIESDDAAVAQHLFDPVNCGRPGTEKHDVDIAQISPGRVDVTGSIEESPPFVFPRRPTGSAQYFFSPVRRAGPGPGDAVDVKRVEHPPFLFHLGHRSFKIRLPRRL